MLTFIYSFFLIFKLVNAERDDNELNSPSFSSPNSSHCSSRPAIRTFIVERIWRPASAFPSLASRSGSRIGDRRLEKTRSSTTSTTWTGSVWWTTRTMRREARIWMMNRQMGTSWTTSVRCRPRPDTISSSRKTFYTWHQNTNRHRQMSSSILDWKINGRGK